MTYNNSSVYSVTHLSKDNCLEGEMESKPKVIKVYLELYLTISSFLLVKCFLKCNLLINYFSISKDLPEDVHTEMFHKYASGSL